MFNQIKNCRFCKSKKLSKILNLGKQPLANALIKKKKMFKFEKKIPLEIVMCNDCKLIQLKHTVKPYLLFRNYFWVTGTSKKITKYREFFFDRVKKFFKKDKNFICEIASNDGFFLDYVKKKNNVLGIDPAKNLAKIARSKKIETLTDFFNYNTSNKIIRLKKKRPNIIICRNVIPHIENINSVIKGIENLLSEDGTGFIEFHNASNLIKFNHYDYIYHEHIFYFTLSSIVRILKKYNLFPIDYFKSPISGGSYVVIFSKKKLPKTKKFIKKIKEEKLKKLDNVCKWKTLENKIYNHKTTFEELLKSINKSKLIAGYGASARSSTLLNYLNLEENKIKQIFDINLMKNKYYTPGTHIQISPPTKKNVNKFDVIILLAWNFKKEIINLLKKLNYKGDIIEPLPVIKKYKIN